MAQYRHVITIPGNVVTDIDNLLRAEGPPQADNGDILAGPYEHSYPTGYTIRTSVVVRNGEFDLCSLLCDMEGEVLQEYHHIDGTLDQDYTFEDDADLYILTLVRGANSQLTEQNKVAYIDSSGVRCPFCGSDDMQGGFVEVNEGRATQTIVCYNCDASWTDVYQLQEIIDEVPPTPQD